MHELPTKAASVERKSELPALREAPVQGGSFGALIAADGGAAQTGRAG